VLNITELLAFPDDNREALQGRLRLITPIQARILQMLPTSGQVSVVYETAASNCKAAHVQLVAPASR
jgi:hypothetical protein